MAGSVQTGDGDSNTLNFSTRPVPPGQRTSKGALTMAWWAVSSAVFYFVVAAALAQGFGAVNAIIGMLLSVVVYSAVNAVIARYAIRTGLSVALFSRILFGNAGAALATLIFFATAIYYAVFEGSVIAVGIHTVFPDVGYAWAALIVILYSVPLSLGSIQSWLDKLNGVLFPLYLLGLVAAVVIAIAEYGYSNAWLALGPAGVDTRGVADALLADPAFSDGPPDRASGRSVPRRSGWRLAPGCLGAYRAPASVNDAGLTTFGRVGAPHRNALAVNANGIAVDHLNGGRKEHSPDIRPASSTLPGLLPPDRRGVGLPPALPSQQPPCSTKLSSRPPGASGESPERDGAPRRGDGDDRGAPPRSCSCSPWRCSSPSCPRPLRQSAVSASASPYRISLPRPPSRMSAPAHNPAAIKADLFS
jgi:hypothetical protein